MKTLKIFCMLMVLGMVAGCTWKVNNPPKDPHHGQQNDSYAEHLNKGK